MGADPVGSPYGPRASIDRIGICEQLSNGQWWLSGWHFDGRFAPGIPVLTHDAEGEPVAVCGWLLNDLRAISNAQFDLAMMESDDPRL